MTEPDEAVQTEQVADLSEDETPADGEGDPSASALDFTLNEGTPRADSFDPAPAPTPPAASLPAEETPAE